MAKMGHFPMGSWVWAPPYHVLHQEGPGVERRPVPELGMLHQPPPRAPPPQRPPSADPGKHYSSLGGSCLVSRGLLPPPHAADGGCAGTGFED